MKYLSTAVGVVASLLGLMLYGMVAIGGLPAAGDLVNSDSQGPIFVAVLVTAVAGMVASVICALKPFIGYWMMMATSIAWFLVALIIIFSLRSAINLSDRSFVIGITFFFFLPTILTALSTFFLRKTALNR